MNKSLLAALIALPVLASIPEAHADPVSDRVYLTTIGVAACGTKGLGFARTLQKPDGSWTAESSEFVVPAGMYLEITSVDYITPYWTAWAMDYTQWINVAIKQRVGTMSTAVLNAAYMNQTFYGGDDTAGYEAIGEIASPGAQTHVASFPIGPLMSSAGRLCATPNMREFWIYGGAVTVRGRLMSSGLPVVTTTTSTNSP
jgi:hypothetical protein